MFPGSSARRVFHEWSAVYNPKKWQNKRENKKREYFLFRVNFI